MKRPLLPILIVFAALCAEGCRRTSRTPQPPVSVLREKDFIFAKRPDEDFKKLIPEPPPPAIPVPVHPDAAKIEEERQRLKRLADTFQMGSEFLLFVRGVPLQKQSIDGFRTHLRRRGLFELRNQLESSAIEVYFISWDGFDDIVCANKSADKGQYAVYSVGAGGVTYVDYQKLDEVIERQELFVLWRHVCNFSLSHFHNRPVDPGDLKLFNTIFNPYDPSPSLARLSKTLPRYVKNPPDPRTYSQFKRYMKDNARPDVLNAIEEFKYRINATADFRNQTDPVVSTNKNVADKGHLTVNTRGNTVYVPPDMLDQWFKKD